MTLLSRMVTRSRGAFFFSSRRRHTRSKRDWSSDVCSSDLAGGLRARHRAARRHREQGREVVRGRGREVQGAHPRTVRATGASLLRHRAAVGRRRHRSRGHAARARPCARGRVERPDGGDALRRLSHVSALAVERQGPLGLVTMNRAERHNAFDDALILELTDAFRSMEAEESVRVVVLSGAGKSFSAGADLHWMKRMAGFSKEENQRDAMGLGALMRTLAHLRKPTLARVHGAAYGGGVGLVACCDIAVATQAATFSLSEVKLGLIPAVIAPYVVAAIGERHARRYFVTGERFDAGQAWRMGLVHELVRDDAELDDTIGQIVDALLQCGPVAQREAKELIRAVANRPVTSEVIQ